MELTFFQTSPACPEIYMVCDENKQVVACMRISRYKLLVTCPNVLDVCVYQESINSRDCFTDDVERGKYLAIAKKKILDFYDKVNNKIEPEYSQFKRANEFRQRLKDGDKISIKNL